MLFCVHLCVNETAISLVCTHLKHQEITQLQIRNCTMMPVVLWQSQSISMHVLEQGLQFIQLN